MKKAFLFVISLMCLVETSYSLDSLVVAYNSFRYKNHVVHSEIKNYRIDRNRSVRDFFEVTFYYENRRKWLNFKIEPVFHRDYFSDEIKEPVFEWNTNGKLLASNKDSVSISKDTFEMCGTSGCGLLGQIVLSGSITGNWEFNPDSAMTINTFQNRVVLIFDNIHQPITRINIWQKKNQSNEWSFAGNYPMVGSLLGRCLDGRKKVGYYFEFNTNRKTYPKPNTITKPMLIVNFYSTN